MSLRQFWTSVRTGAGFLFPVVTVDSQRLDADQVETKLRNTDIWLTPRSVEGFHEEDFPFLDEETRQRLSECVRDFIAVAEQVPSNQPATELQLQAALPAFLGVLEIMRPDKYADLDAFVVGKRVEKELKEQLPEWVRELRFFESGEDVTGDPAIWIWVEMTDAAAKRNVFSQNTREVRSMIVDCVRRLGIEFWPFVHFRTASELAEIAAETE